MPFFWWECFYYLSSLGFCKSNNAVIVHTNPNKNELGNPNWWVPSYIKCNCNPPLFYSPLNWDPFEFYVSNQSFALLKIMSKTVSIMDFQCIMLAAPKNDLGSKNVKSFKYVVLRKHSKCIYCLKKYNQKYWTGSNR